MKEKMISIKDIEWKAPKVDHKDISNLAKDLHLYGQKLPLLVVRVEGQDNKQVVDGAKRILALRSNGVLRYRAIEIDINEPGKLEKKYLDRIDVESRTKIIKNLITNGCKAQLARNFVHENQKEMVA